MSITTSPQSFSRPRYRPDIDGMRALAILSVLIFHAYPNTLLGGFVGVDIFFVISGYLISNIIFRGLALGSFSFFDFYARRVRRIFPAVTIVLLGSFLLGFFFLRPEEFKDLIAESPYAAFFVENWRLYVTTGGYWEVATELQPFMHFWSLGVEEQYYIFYPLICFLLWRVSARKFLASLVLMFVISWGLCLYDTSYESVRAFYSLHTRFWELLIGGILAYVELIWPDYKNYLLMPTNEGGSYIIDNFLSCIGFSLIVFSIFFIEEGDSFPGWKACLPTIGAVLIIAAGSEAFLNKYIFANKLAVFIGLISYPLYLWHWPIICIFRNNLAGEIPSGWLMCLLILSSFLLAYLTYNFVERPMRSKKATWSLVLVLFVVLLIVSLGSKQLIRHSQSIEKVIDNGIPDSLLQLREDLDEKEKSDAVCKAKFGEGFDVCRATSHNPSVLILGDSHTHVMWKYLKTVNELPDFYLLGKDAFFTFKDAYLIKRQGKNNDLARHFWSIIENSPEIDSIVLRSYWGNYLAQSLHSDLNSAWNSEEIFQYHWRETFKTLKALNKKVFVVLDNPVLPPTLLKRCIRTQRVSLLPDNVECNVNINEMRYTYKFTREFLIKEAAHWDNVTLIDLEKELCQKGKCPVWLNGELLYVDDNHLSFYGNKKIWPLIQKAVWGK